MAVDGGGGGNYTLLNYVLGHCIYICTRIVEPEEALLNITEQEELEEQELGVGVCGLRYVVI